MQGLIKCCARGALGLGVAALLGVGVPAHASPSAGALGLQPAVQASWLDKSFTGPDRLPLVHRLPAPAHACREGQLRLAQSTPSPQEADQLEQRRLKEQREQEKKRQEKLQSKPPESLKKAAPPPQGEVNRGIRTFGAPPAPRERMDKSAAPPREVPAKAGMQKFGAQPIRAKEPSPDE
ncbi:MAG: hypothetical protein WBV23_16370 [Desulfobaccales bacterium]